MLNEFKKFILRGNVVELAVAVVIGAAFTAVVNGFVADFLTPLIGAVQGKQDFSKYVFTFSGIEFKYGHFISIVISFLATAAVVFFLVVQPLNRLNNMAAKSKKTPEPSTRKCPDCLSEISKQASRCAFCTSKVTPEK